AIACFGSNPQMRSLPRRTPETSPAVASTLRCLVTAWRVTADPAVSRVIDRGPSELSRATSASRVSSPSAANIGAARATSRVLPLYRDISRDVRELLRPARVVHPECLGTPCQRDAIGACMEHGELGASRDFLELVFDQGGRFTRVVHFEIVPAWKPAIRNRARRLHSLDGR